MAVKQITSGSEARMRIAEGVDAIANAVGTTLGPKGRNVVIEKSFGSPKVTKDGVTVAKEITLKDKLKNMGAQLIKEAATKTNDNAGDGTSGTCVLANALVKGGIKKVTAGFNPMGIKRGIDAAVKIVVEDLKNRSKQVDNSSEKVRQIATVSANGDTEIGQKLAETIESVGKDGVITIEEATKSEGFEVEKTEGMYFDRGYLSPYFITNSDKMLTEYDKPYILIVEKKISNLQQLLPVLEAVVQTGNPLVIIAEDIEGEALATLVLNRLRGGLKVVAVKAPGFGDRRKAMLEDIAVVTNGQVISEDLGQKLENTTIEHLGQARKIVVSKDATTIIGGNGEQNAIQSRLQQLKSEISESTSDYDKEKLQERVAKLAGGIAILKVGGITEAEAKERKDRVEDAHRATMAAIEEGISIGGGCALLYASKALDNVKLDDEDEQAGVAIVKNALSATVRRIVENAGGDASLVVAKLLEDMKDNMIYDARHSEYVDAYKAGIIDPTKVVRIAIQSAASVAGLIITMEAAICDEPEDKSSSGGSAPHMPSGMGGMGGMGGMDF